MRELSISLGFGLASVLLVYVVISKLFPNDAGQIAAGALAVTPFIYELLKKKQLKLSLETSRIDISRLTENSFYITVVCAAAVIFGWTNIIGFINAVIVRGALQIEPTNEMTIARAVVSSTLVPSCIVYFTAGRWVALTRGNRVLCIFAITILTILLGRLSEFFLIPQDWFDRAYPWSERTPSEFIKFILYPIPIILLPLSAGAYWYSRRIIFLKAASLLRLLPVETQKVVLDLINGEISTRKSAIPPN